ncbi:hypothetical protein POSPLADRAFT_1052584 [Postia placenta MAD-698-R-SB12]|uniref:Uncharacterized protein n=1 Tax=Postia placenta MAD-698-R-SB12 TaxID=670580 RepID=A0A1X6NBN1_9APHY|nr:hypothetical protein POSPLADRAFT_1052584 [Postia placenta MAD-698-R-SB12]OSX65912.1 hypothetical protein POSPLADRAFT_1052584 [Postia placenta MAD-698-R-SB12]
MSSTGFETALNILDATADGVTIVAPAAKPAFKAIAGLSPWHQLKRGDKAQTSTLEILEDTAQIMEVDLHNILQTGYDGLRTARADLAKMGAIKALRKRKQFSKYATSAVQLNDTTVSSSQAARSQRMWNNKGLPNGSTSDSASAQAQSPNRGATNALTEDLVQDDTASVDITSIYEDPFRETASVIVSDTAFGLRSESIMEESESIYSEPGDIDHDDSFRLHTLRQSGCAQ